MPIDCLEQIKKKKAFSFPFFLYLINFPQLGTLLSIVIMSTMSLRVNMNIIKGFKTFLNQITFARICHLAMDLNTKV